MARQSVLGLILDTHLRTPLARVNWPYLTGRLLAHPWEVLLQRIRVEGGLRNRPKVEVGSGVAVPASRARHSAGELLAVSTP